MNKRMNTLRGLVSTLFALAAAIGTANAATFTWNGADDASWQDSGSRSTAGAWATTSAKAGMTSISTTGATILISPIAMDGGHGDSQYTILG